MKLSSNGAARIHHFEHCRLVAYPDPGSVNGEPWTIGWGSTKIDGKPVKKGMKITQAKADEQFAKDVERFERSVEAALGSIEVTQEMFDALVSFDYNTGSLAKSTLLRCIKAGDFAAAQLQFLRWIRNDGNVMMGLVKRRLAEAELFGPRSKEELIAHLPSAIQVRLRG